MTLPLHLGDLGYRRPVKSLPLPGPDHISVLCLDTGLRLGTHGEQVLAPRTQSSALVSLLLGKENDREDQERKIDRKEERREERE